MAEKEADALRDIILGSVFIILGIVVLLLSQNIPKAIYDPLGPAFLPRGLAYLCIIFSGVILFYGIRKKIACAKQGKKIEEEKAPVSYTRHPKVALFAMALFFLYVLALHVGISGFRTLTILFILILGGVLFKFSGRKGIIKPAIILVVLSLILSLGLHFLFTQVFITDLY